MYDRYESPLITRYASVSMQQLFSAQRRAATWRRLGLGLGEEGAGKRGGRSRRGFVY